MIKIKKIRHICLVVSNYEKMLKFYTNVLGFIVKRNSVYVSKDLENALGVKKTQIKCSILILENSDLEIEITNFINSKQLTNCNKANDLGYRHIAFFVEDINKAYTEINNLNIEIISGPVSIKAKDNLEVRVFFFKDPEGNIIELNQI